MPDDQTDPLDLLHDAPEPPVWRLMDSILAKQLGRLEKTVENGVAEMRRDIGQIADRVGELEKWRYAEAAIRSREREDEAHAANQRSFRFTRLQLTLAALGSAGGVAGAIELLHRATG